MSNKSFKKQSTLTMLTDSICCKDGDKRELKQIRERGKCKLGVTVSYFRGLESLNWHKLRDANLLANNILHLGEQNRALIVRCKLGPSIFRQLYRKMWLGG